MSKSTIAALAVALIIGGIAAVVLIRPFGGETALVREMSEQFLKDVQFKDFRASSLYNHVLDRERIDIGRAIEEMFQVKPELLDIKEYRISRVDIDEKNGRAKVLVTVRFRILNEDKKTRENEMTLYWLKRHPDCPHGSSCPKGQCADEFGEVIFQPKNPNEENRRRSQISPSPRTDKEGEVSDKPYECDVSAEKKWFMNVDSTFKSKDYRNSTEQ